MRKRCDQIIHIARSCADGICVVVVVAWADTTLVCCGESYLRDGWAEIDDLYNV